MPLLGASPLALPEQADLSGAWEETIGLADGALGTFVFRLTPGETYEQLLAGFFNFITNAAAGNRTPVIQINDANHRAIGFYPASAPVGPATTAQVSVVVGSGQAYSDGLGHIVISIPALLLFPGAAIIFTGTGLQAGDQITAPTMTYLRIPTAPPQKVAEAARAIPSLV